MSGGQARLTKREAAKRGRTGRIRLGVLAAATALGMTGGLLWSVGLAQAAGASTSHGVGLGKHGTQVHAKRLRSSRAKRAHAAPSSLTVEEVLPAADNGPITATESIMVELSEPLAAHSPMPQVSVPGTWQQEGTALVFEPTLGLIPSSTVSVTIPGGSNGLQGRNGARLSAPVQASWLVQPGSLLRAYQLLAGLGYLPVTWTPASETPMTPADQLAALYSPPAGTFSWRYPNTPASLQAMWSPGAQNVMLKGAVMAFESNEGLTTDGQLGPAVWTKLLQATTSPSATAAATNPSGYTYDYVSKALPESMTVWHDGSVVVQTPVNTGIPGYDTTDGTFPVYERLQSQVMMGTNPNGSHYADPVAWVAYFNGGDAVHYIDRASFGYPQSLGCVETPYNAAEQAWGYLTMGSLVTITG